MLSRRSFIKGLGLAFIAINLNITSFGQLLVPNIDVIINNIQQKYGKDYEVINNMVVFKEPPLGSIEIINRASSSVG